MQAPSNSVSSTPNRQLTTEEKLPLKNFNYELQRSRCAPLGNAFNLIILFIIVVSVAVTVSLITHISYHYKRDYVRHGSVITENKECGEIGSDVLNEGGSAVDIVIAIQICLGVTLPHLTGIGGGGFMIIYKHDGSHENMTINFKEVSPIISDLSQFIAALPSGKNAMQIGVPGFLKGLWVAHQKYGKLPWKRLVQPSVKLATEGFTVSSSLYSELAKQTLTNSFLTSVFMPNGTLVAVNSVVKWQALAQTLSEVADNGPDVIYNGSLTDSILQEISLNGGVLTSNDFHSYQPIVEYPLSSSFSGMQLMTPQLPSGGPALLLVLKLLEQFNNETDDHSDVHMYHNLIQAIKTGAAAVIGMNESATEAQDFLSEEMANILSQFSETSVHNSHNIRLPAATISAAVDSTEMYAAAVRKKILVQGLPLSISDLLIGQLVGFIPPLWLHSNGLQLTGLGSPFGSEVVTSSGIIFNNAITDLNGTAYKWTAQRLSPLTTMAPVIVVRKDHPCGMRFAAASADYQMLVQIMLHIEATYPLASFVELPRLRVDTDGQSDVQFDDLSNITSVIQEGLSRLGHIISPQTGTFDSIGIIRKIRSVTEAYMDDKHDGFSLVT